MPFDEIEKQYADLCACGCGKPATSLSVVLHARTYHFFDQTHYQHWKHLQQRQAAKRALEVGSWNGA